ncbi:MAG: transposase, partial [Bacteroides sp.]|nr:transposase [Bacteroides sp.]
RRIMCIYFKATVMLPTVNNELKNMAQIEHSGHRSVANLTANLTAATSSYCFFPKKPMIASVRERRL